VTTPTPTRPPEGRPDRPSAASTTPSAAPAGELHCRSTPIRVKPRGVFHARAVARPDVVVRAARWLAAVRPAVKPCACESGC
jgi:hypothetical protein